MYFGPNRSPPKIRDQDQNHMLKPCLHLCMCEPTHSRGFQKTGMGSEQEHYRQLYSWRKDPPVNPQYDYMSAVCSCPYIPSHFVKEI